MAEGHVQPTEKCIPLCPQTFLRAQDWEWGEGGSGVDQVQSSLSSLFSVAEDATSEPMEATSAQDSTSRESFSFSLVLCPGGRGESNSWDVNGVWEKNPGEGIRVLLLVVMGRLGWDEGKYKTGEPRQARSGGRMG